MHVSRNAESVDFECHQHLSNITAADFGAYNDNEGIFSGLERNNASITNIANLLICIVQCCLSLECTQLLVKK